MGEALDLLGDTIADMASGPHLGGHQAITKKLMTRLAEKGQPLSHLADQRMMKLSIGTLRGYARQFGLSFPDYVPMALRKQVALVQSGDFFEVIGADAAKVAGTLGVAVMSRNGRPMCCVPAHGLADATKQLKAAWFIVKVVRSKKRKAAAHA